MHPLSAIEALTSRAPPGPANAVLVGSSLAGAVQIEPSSLHLWFVPRAPTS